MLARIKFLAERNGIPLAQLIGPRVANMIDVTPVQVEEDDGEEY